VCEGEWGIEKENAGIEKENDKKPGRRGKRRKRFFS
jgi:hypothetical protein